MPPPALFLASAIALAPALAPAAALAAPPEGSSSAPCWYEHGVVVVAASVAGIAGDYILDTGSPITRLHETRAQTAGFAATALRGEVRLAGLTLSDQPVEVADLDAPTFAFPTPIAGVIGADVLAGRILDIDFAPCRVAVYAPGAAPRFRASVSLPLSPGLALPAVQGAVSDGHEARRGTFIVATGLDAPLRLSEALAAVSPAPADPKALLPDGGGRASLRALSLGDELFERLPAGLTPAPPPGADIESADMKRADGAIGPGVLDRWRLRLDLSRRVLRLAR